MDANSSAPVSPPPPKVVAPPRESLISRFLRGVRNLLLLILLLLVLLWNWDGFWQTNIGFLRNAQERYLPAKLAQEQQKVSNVGLHNSEMEKLRGQVAALEAQIAQLQGATAAEAQQKSYLQAALRIIANLSGKLPAEQLEAIRSSCTSLECEEIFSKGLALTE